MAKLLFFMLSVVVAVMQVTAAPVPGPYPGILIDLQGL